MKKCCSYYAALCSGLLILVNQLSQIIIHQACISFWISGGFVKILEIVFQIERDCFTQGVNCYK